MEIDTMMGKDIFIKLGRPELVSRICTDKSFQVVDTGVEYINNKNELSTVKFYFDKPILIVKNTVYIVLRNNDFTEGRGPMVFHKVFRYIEDAVQYIFTQSGICGSPQYFQHSLGVSVNDTPYIINSFNGYDLITAMLE